VHECACHFRHINTIPNEGGNGEINEISWQTSRGTYTRAVKAAGKRERKEERERERERERKRERDKLLHVLVNQVSASFFFIAIAQSERKAEDSECTSMGERPWEPPRA